MEQITHYFSMVCYDSIDELDEEARRLILMARMATSMAYVPYSSFRVGVALLLGNGQILQGANQENAAFPAGLCAERVALSAASSRYPDVAIKKMALSYRTVEGEDDHPISPCGICRQTLVEYESRQQGPIGLLMAGGRGRIYGIASVAGLLPLTFSAKDMK